MRIAICFYREQGARRLQRFLYNMAQEKNVKLEVDIFLGSKLEEMARGEYQLYIVQEALGLVAKPIIGLLSPMVLVQTGSWGSCELVGEAGKGYGVPKANNAYDKKRIADKIYDVDLRVRLPMGGRDESLLTAFVLRQYHRNNAFFFKEGRSFWAVKYGDILYFEAQGRKVVLKTENARHCFYASLKAVEEQLDRDYFFRTNKSFIVNINFISCTDFNSIQMTDGAWIGISPKQKNIFREKYIDFMNGNVL